MTIEIKNPSELAVPPALAAQLTDVHRVATVYHLTSYDPAYLELALRRSLPLATLDGELLAACKAVGLNAFAPADRI